MSRPYICVYRYIKKNKECSVQCFMFITYTHCWLALLKFWIHINVNNNTKCDVLCVKVKECVKENYRKIFCIMFFILRNVTFKPFSTPYQCFELLTFVLFFSIMWIYLVFIILKYLWITSVFHFRFLDSKINEKKLLGIYRNISKIIKTIKASH